MEDALTDIFMKRFRMSPETARYYARGYIAQGKVSAATQIADYVPQQLFETTQNVAKAQTAADARYNQIAEGVPQNLIDIYRNAYRAGNEAGVAKDDLAKQLIPGPPAPRPQVPGNNVPPYLRAAIDARDSVYREAQDPLMAAALRVYGYNDAHTQFSNARGLRDELSAPSGKGPEVDAQTRQYMIDYLNRK